MASKYDGGDGEHVPGVGLGFAVRQAITGKSADRLNSARTVRRAQPQQWGVAVQAILMTSPPVGRPNDLPPLPADWQRELRALVNDRRFGRQRRKNVPQWRFDTADPSQDAADWQQHLFHAAAELWAKLPVDQQAAGWSAYVARCRRLFWVAVNRADQLHLAERAAYHRGAGIHPGRPRVDERPDPAHTYSHPAGTAPPAPREFRTAAGGDPPDPNERWEFYLARVRVRPYPMLTGDGRVGEAVADLAAKSALQGIIERKTAEAEADRRDGLYRLRQGLADLEHDIKVCRSGFAAVRAAHRRNARNATRRRAGAARVWPDAVPDPRPPIGPDQPVAVTARLRAVPYCVNVTGSRRSRSPARMAG